MQTPQSLPCSNISDSRLLRCLIEGYNEGERRAIARAHLVEVRPGLFEVIPFSLKEISGPRIEWHSPKIGQAIPSSESLTSLEEAQRLLSWWATYTVAVRSKEYNADKFSDFFPPEI